MRVQREKRSTTKYSAAFVEIGTTDMCQGKGIDLPVGKVQSQQSSKTYTKWTMSLVCCILVTCLPVFSVESFVLDQPRGPFFGRCPSIQQTLSKGPPMISSSSSSSSIGGKISSQLLALMEDDDELEFVPEDDDYGGFEPFTESEAKSLTIPQLKQQLRLRGLKVSGKKQELIDRLVDFASVGQATVSHKDNGGDTAIPVEAEILPESSSISDNAVNNKRKKKKMSLEEAQEHAKANGKEIIDVDAYLDDDDKGKAVKSSIPPKKEKDPDADVNAPTLNPETWGEKAKIVDDFEGRQVVVDGLSRTVVEYMGSNQTQVQAFVVASRDALKPFLAGGANRTGAPEERLREIQMKRESSSKRPVHPDEELEEGIDAGDEKGHYKDVMHRDYSDWGEYTATGEQLSAQEVQGVLLLSDVYGAFSGDTRALAEKIAFECQPVVVMVPDLFRGSPWKEDPTTPGLNDQGKDYEEWRETHPDLRVSVDIRAAASVLRQQYGVSSITVWGMCYGGGRALEIAAGHLPERKVHDVDGSIGPPPVNPMVAIAWYPTRYNAGALFGKDRAKRPNDGGRESLAVMAVFAGNDKLPGATPNDAATLKSLLSQDRRVKDFMVKVFPDQDHGFAHIGLSRPRTDTLVDEFVDNEFGGTGKVTMGDSDAEVASLLSTAFMETYSRVFLPTVGTPVVHDEEAAEWSADLEMKDLNNISRDIRKEIDDAISNYEPPPLNTETMVDWTNPADHDKLRKLLRNMEPSDTPANLRIQDDDDMNTMFEKLTTHDPSFQIL